MRRSLRVASRNLRGPSLVALVLGVLPVGEVGDGGEVAIVVGQPRDADEHADLAAVLAYEVSRIRSWDVALSSWAVALTSSAISAVDDPDGDNFLKAILGVVPRRLAESLQVWALRDQGVERDRAAVQVTRNPASLIHALEKLDADASRIRHVSRSTAPLWLEFPPQVLGPMPSRAAQRLARELLLDERIDLLRELAGQPSRPVTR